MILVLVEHAAGRPERVSLEALALAARLGDLLGITVEGLLVGADGASAATYLAGTGLARLHLVDDERLVPYAPAAWAAALLEVARGSGAAAIVAGGSDRGNEVLAHVGARSGQPMAANCTAVELVDGRLRIVRQRWAGSLLEDAWLDGTPLLLTVAPHVLGPVEADPGALAPAVVPARPPLDERDLLVRVVERVESGGGGVSLADARVVVGGGRGVGSADGFALLEELAG
ncbi:MAG TPA: hypothetical protein VNJ28_04150, partial [Candidatus Limnocylindrales bacterium]|nr:hypothetical protein [Candidatus Limnocylindrales bacterium]